MKNIENLFVLNQYSYIHSLFQQLLLYALLSSNYSIYEINLLVQKLYM